MFVILLPVLDYLGIVQLFRVSISVEHHVELLFSIICGDQSFKPHPVLVAFFLEEATIHSAILKDPIGWNG